MDTRRTSNGLVRAVTFVVRRSIAARILGVALVSLVLLAAATVVTVQRVATDAMMDQVWTNIRNTIALADANLRVHGAPTIVDGKLHFGDWNPAAAPDFFDQAGTKTGFGFTLMQVREGKLIRIVTNLKNPDGNRNVGTPAADDVTAILLRGEHYEGVTFTAGLMRVGYFDPIKDSSGKVIGAFGGGLSLDNVGAVSQRVSWAVSTVAIIALAVGGGLL